MARQQRPMAAILAQAGQDKARHSDETKQRLLAYHVWTMALEGKLTFADGRTIEASAKDWKDVTSWLFNHLDGPVRKEIDLDVTSRDSVAAMTDEQLIALVGGALGAEPTETEELAIPDEALSPVELVG